MVVVEHTPVADHLMGNTVVAAAVDKVAVGIADTAVVEDSTAVGRSPYPDRSCLGLVPVVAHSDANTVALSVSKHGTKSGAALLAALLLLGGADEKKTYSCLVVAAVVLLSGH